MRRREGGRKVKGREEGRRKMTSEMRMRGQREGTKNEGSTNKERQKGLACLPCFFSCVALPCV